MGTTRILDAALVEDLHHLIIAEGDQERAVVAVGTVDEFTLTGLVEYGCLRWHFKNLPPLSGHLMQSPLGRAITDAAGPTARAAVIAGKSDEDMKPRECEFVFLRSEEDLLSQRADFFRIRFAKSAQAVGFDVRVSHCLQAGLGEMMDNAIRHARASARIVAGYNVRERTATFVVADVGRGILASLRESSKYAALTHHAEAIRLALHDGVTSSDNHGGRGFNDLFKALAMQWGLLRFRSGTGCITIDGRGADADAGIVSFPPDLPGFQVSVSCSAGGSSAAEMKL